MLAMVSVIITSAAIYLLMGRGISEGWKIPGLLVGLYTGGTPNLAAIKTALQVEQNLYLAVHTSDILLGALYILFVITIARRVFSLVLRKKEAGAADETFLQDKNPYRDFFKKEFRFPILAAFAIAAGYFRYRGCIKLYCP